MYWRSMVQNSAELRNFSISIDLPCVRKQLHFGFSYSATREFSCTHSTNVWEHNSPELLPIWVFKSTLILAFQIIRVTWRILISIYLSDRY